MRRLLLLATVLALPACAVHIMDAELISMTKTEMPKKVTKDKTIEEKWCINDKPAKEEMDKRYGLIDQVVLKAQNVYKADYFADASFFQKGTCMVMTATVVK